MCPSTDNTLSRAREDTRIANREYEDNPNRFIRPPNIEDENETIIQVIQPLEIKRGDF